MAEILLLGGLITGSYLVSKKVFDKKENYTKDVYSDRAIQSSSGEIYGNNTVKLSKRMEEEAAEREYEKSLSYLILNKGRAPENSVSSFPLYSKSQVKGVQKDTIDPRPFETFDAKLPPTAKNSNGMLYGNRKFVSENFNFSSAPIEKAETADIQRQPDAKDRPNLVGSSSLKRVGNDVQKREIDNPTFMTKFEPRVVNVDRPKINLPPQTVFSVKNVIQNKEHLEVTKNPEITKPSYLSNRVAGSHSINTIGTLDTIGTQQNNFIQLSSQAVRDTQEGIYINKKTYDTFSLSGRTLDTIKNKVDREIIPTGNNRIILNEVRLPFDSTRVLKNTNMEAKINRKYVPEASNFKSQSATNVTSNNKIVIEREARETNTLGLRNDTNENRLQMSSARITPYNNSKPIIEDYLPGHISVPELQKEYGQNTMSVIDQELKNRNYNSSGKPTLNLLQGYTNQVVDNENRLPGRILSNPGRLIPGENRPLTN
jgi:hypothetical protein